MSKTEVLALLNSCKIKAAKALKRSDLSDKQRKDIEAIDSTVSYYQAYVEGHVKETDTAILNQYATQFKGLYEDLKQLAAPTSLMELPKGAVVKVEKVISEEKQQEHTKKQRRDAGEIIKNILATLGVIALIALLAFSIRSCVHKTPDKDLNDNRPGIEQQDYVRPIETVNIHDYDQLMGYSGWIQSQLPEGSNISIEDIMYAIRLANFDTLQDKAVFKDRDEVYESTRVAGDIATALGSDYIIQRDKNTDIFVSEAELKDMIMCVTDNRLSINVFAGIKTDKGYDIHSIADILIKGMYAGTENDVYYAKLFNDLLARKVCAFTITENSPISTYYTLLGMYHTNSPRILELTSGIGLTSVYGDETRIDGYYGFICVEELEAYLHVGNEQNIFYTDIIDQNITNYSQDRTRN